MRVLVTGHHGYIGTVLVPLAQQAGHDVVGLDSDLFAPCIFGDAPAEIESIRKDVRDVEVADLEGFDAVLHLAAVCNDPVGDLNPQTTYDINQIASAELAAKAKQAGVARFVFFSSCSLYGKADGDDALDESAGFAPVTAYGESKVLAEQDIAPLADDDLQPDLPAQRDRLRRLAAAARSTSWSTTSSAGRTPPARSCCRATARRGARSCTSRTSRARRWPCSTLRASSSTTRRSTSARTAENYTIREVAEIVAEVTGAPATFAAGGGEPDKRSYRVDCSKLARVLPEAVPQWTVKRGAEQLAAAYAEWGMTYDDFTGLARPAHQARARAAGRRPARRRAALDAGRASADDLHAARSCRTP